MEKNRILFNLDSKMIQGLEQMDTEDLLLSVMKELRGTNTKIRVIYLNCAKKFSFLKRSIDR